MAFNILRGAESSLTTWPSYNIFRILVWGIFLKIQTKIMLLRRFITQHLCWHKCLSAVTTLSEDTR
jgi:hypothetical protein